MPGSTSSTARVGAQSGKVCSATCRIAEASGAWAITSSWAMVGMLAAGRHGSTEPQPANKSLPRRWVVRWRCHQRLIDPLAMREDGYPRRAAGNGQTVLGSLGQRRHAWHLQWLGRRQWLPELGGQGPWHGLQGRANLGRVRYIGPGQRKPEPGSLALRQAHAWALLKLRLAREHRHHLRAGRSGLAPVQCGLASRRQAQY
mmetsp:Transcript_14129/g.26618  ORF Transcript_14129/g.26618 Transcript_14129/m.26618 type:complete len:201 (-) Transcript_14129:2198-2800(-)